MVITGILPFFLYLSLLSNVALIGYSTKYLYRINDIEEDMIMLMERNELFLENLEQINSLVRYYGDQDLQRLINP